MAWPSANANVTVGPVGDVTVIVPSELVTVVTPPPLPAPHAAVDSTTVLVADSPRHDTCVPVTKPENVRPEENTCATDQVLECAVFRDAVTGPVFAEKFRLPSALLIDETPATPLAPHCLTNAVLAILLLLSQVGVVGAVGATQPGLPVPQPCAAAPPMPKADSAAASKIVFTSRIIF